MKYRLFSASYLFANKAERQEKHRWAITTSHMTTYSPAALNSDNTEQAVQIRESNINDFKGAVFLKNLSSTVNSHF